MKELKDRIQSDEKYAKFITTIRTNKQRINVNVLMDEIRDISEIRAKSSLAFAPKEKLLQALLEENLKAQAYRSRLAEICVQSNRIISKLEIAVSKMKDHINVNYYEEIKSLGRTKEERNYVIVSLLGEATQYIDSLKDMIKMAEIVIMDIDKQHYSLKLTLDALNLHVSKEHIL